jgi:hypothetical protein
MKIQVPGSQVPSPVKTSGVAGVDAPHPKLVQVIERAVMKELERAVGAASNRHIFDPIGGDLSVRVQASLKDALFSPFASLNGFRVDDKQLPSLEAAVNTQLASYGYHASLRVENNGEHHDDFQLALRVRAPAYLQQFRPTQLTDADRAFLLAHPRK